MSSWWTASCGATARSWVAACRSLGLVVVLRGCSVSVGADGGVGAVLPRFVGTAPRWRVEYAADGRRTLGVACPRRPTESATVSATLLPVPEPEVDSLAAPPTGRAVSGAASAASSALAAMSGGFGAADLQALAAVGFSGCAPVALRQSSGYTKYLLSPFADLDWGWVVVGNVLVAVCACAVHAVGA